jgi:hypothetical protein
MRPRVRSVRCQRCHRTDDCSGACTGDRALGALIARRDGEMAVPWDRWRSMANMATTSSGSPQKQTRSLPRSHASSPWPRPGGAWQAGAEPTPLCRSNQRPQPLARYASGDRSAGCPVSRCLIVRTRVPDHPRDQPAPPQSFRGLTLAVGTWHDDCSLTGIASGELSIVDTAITKESADEDRPA